MRPELERVLEPELGRAGRDVSTGPDSPYVILITEPFGNKAALRRIAEIIAALSRTGAVDLVCIEAASGSLPLEPLRVWRGQRARYPNPSRAVESGEIDYLAYLFLVLDREPDLFGVEDPALYAKTLTVGRPLIRTREDWSRRIAPLLHSLTGDPVLAGLSRKYRNFLRSCREGDDADFPPVELLSGYVRTLKLETGDLLEYQQLLATQRLEKTIDFGAANREREDLQERIVALAVETEPLLHQSFEEAGLALEEATPRSLMDHLSPGALEGLPLSLRMRQTPLGRLLIRELQTAQGEPPSKLHELFNRSFARWLADMAEAVRGQDDPAGLGKLFNFLLEFMVLLNLDLDRFPNLIRYAHYLNRFLTMDLFAAVPDLQKVKERIVDRLATTDADRLHASVSRRLARLSEMCALEMTPATVAWVQHAAAEMEHGRLCADLDGFLPHAPELEDLRAREAEYEKRFEDTMLYYNLMACRATAMAESTLARMRDTGRRSAVLLTGGFHQETVFASLERHGASYTAVLPWLPRATLGEETSRYFETLLRQGV